MGGTFYMSAMADEARRMAEKYRALADAATTEDRRRFSRMATWWEKRAKDLEAGAPIGSPAPSRPDTKD
jgi:hypothetical protein